MNAPPDRPRRIVWWLFSILAAIGVLILLAELVSFFIAAGGTR